MPAYGSYRVDPAAGLVYGKRGKPVGCPDTAGYLRVDIYLGRRRATRAVHNWVWEEVHGPIPPDLEVNHKNGVKTDNRIENLELLTHQQNIQHAYDTGLKTNRGMKHPSRKLNEEQVYEIRRRMDAGDHYLAVAKDFGVVYTTVYEIAARKTWPHLPEKESA